MIKVFKKYSKIKVVYLFGSLAKGRAGQLSDIDLAILLDEPFENSIKLQLLSDLVSDGYENADVLILNDASLTLRFEATHFNQLVYCRPDFDGGDYFSKTLREYFDFLPSFTTLIILAFTIN